MATTPRISEEHAWEAVRFTATERGVNEADAEWLVNLAKGIYEAGTVLLNIGNDLTPLDFARILLDTDVLPKAVATVEKHFEKKIGCRQGCVACCDYSVSISGLEGDRLLKAIKAMPKKKRQKIFARTAEAIAKGMDKLKHAERLEKRFPCPLLIDGLCSVYDERPIACRAWFGWSARQCGSTTEGTPFGLPALMGDTAALGIHITHIMHGDSPDPGGDLISILADRLGIRPHSPYTMEEHKAYLEDVGVDIEKLRKKHRK